MWYNIIWQLCRNTRESKMARSIKTWICRNCNNPFEKVNTGHTYLFCSKTCATLYNRPSQTLVIPDGQPMSKRTLHRRKKAAGLVFPPTPNYPDLNFFSSWSSELAWMIGLIWSDGCLSGNTVEICSKDFQLIDLVMSLTGGRYGLKNQGQHLRITFTSKEITNFLRSVGLTERKSLTVEWPKMPTEYMGDFMRGLIDGDGSVLIREDRPGQQVPDLVVQLVTASQNLRSGIAQWFDNQNIRYGLSYRDMGNGLWKFSVRHQESLRTLYRLLYPSDHVVCLHRKYNPYSVWMDTPRIRSGRTKA